MSFCLELKYGFSLELKLFGRFQALLRAIPESVTVFGMALPPSSQKLVSRKQNNGDGMLQKSASRVHTTKYTIKYLVYSVL